MHNNYQKLQHVIEQAVNYFQINGKMNYATALRNATGYVLMYESGNHGYRQYRKDVNRNLCESLYFMNSDPYCPIHIKKTVRQVLESYRKMNGLSTAEFKSDRGDKFVNINECVSLIESFESEKNDIKNITKSNMTFMKAPNGEHTNLSEKLWLFVRTSAFKQWFGDWENSPELSSKVVDQNGQPMLMYHGSPMSGITQFKAGESPYGDDYIFFTSLPEQAMTYTGYDQDDFQDWDQFDEVVSEEGLIYEAFLNIRDKNRIYERSSGEIHALAISNNQIKLIKNQYEQDEEVVDKKYNFARQVVRYMIAEDMVESDMQDECLEQVLSILDEYPQAMMGGSELDQIAFVRGYGDTIVDALEQVMDSVAYRNRWRDYQEQDEQDIIIEQAFTGRAFPYRAVQPKEQPVTEPVKKHLTVADKIRKALKQKLGYNSRQVSVKTHNYSGGSTTYVSIKQQGLDKKAIYEIASNFSNVRYDEFTGQYLLGGNRVEVHDVDGTWLDWRDFENEDVQQNDYELATDVFNRAYDMFDEMEGLEELYDDDVISYVQRELTKQFGRQSSQEQFKRFSKEIRDAYNAVMQNIRRGIR